MAVSPAIDLQHGDCRELLRELPDASIDAVVTDPPYHLTQVSRGGSPRQNDPETPFGRTRLGERGFMGQTWDGGGIAFDPELWVDVLRVLKPGAHLLAFGGTRTYHRMACAIEDAGFEIRDSIHWIYGTGFPKSLNLGEGRGTALKPAHEPILLARKPVEGTATKNVEQWGTGALNIDACRIATSAEDQAYIAERIGGFNNTRSIGGNGAYQGGETIDRTTYDASKGRWPANIVFDEDAAAELDAQSGELGGGTARLNREIGRTAVSTRAHNVRQPNQTDSVCNYGDRGGASRFFYCAKASRSEREQGCEHLPLRTAGEVTGGREEGSAGLDNPRAGAGRTSGARNHHPTVKPISLMRWLVRLITPPDGIVLDPFMGSGTTGVAAKAEGVHFIGMEQDAEYLVIAEARIA